MYCPRCGQQQVSENIKFCSKCGFPLVLISEVLSNGGFLPQLAALYKSKKKLTKRNGMIFSLFWLLFFVLIMTPFFGILDIDELAGMSAIFGIFGGLIIFLSSVFFLENPRNQYVPETNFIANADERNLGNSTVNALPPQQSIPAENYVSPQGRWRTPDTADFAQPPSVTDGTTRLLQKED